MAIRVLLVSPDQWVVDAARSLDPLEYKAVPAAFEEASEEMTRTETGVVVVNAEQEPRRAWRVLHELAKAKRPETLLIATGSRAQEGTLRATTSLRRGADDWFVKLATTDFLDAVGRRARHDPHVDRLSKILAALVAIIGAEPLLAYVSRPAAAVVGLLAGAAGTVLGWKARKGESRGYWLAFPIAMALNLAYLVHLAWRALR